jgi:uroporphyrinogen-III synthase
VIAFTSSPQVRRLFAVAEAAGREAALRSALHRTVIAAVGPVVAEELARRGFAATVAPSDAFFMKPLVSAIVAACGSVAAGR